MKHLKALGIKFIVISIVLLSVLTIFSNATIGGVLVISAMVTGVSYIIGDLFILPRLGNMIATIADFGLAFASVWILSAIFIGTAFPILTASVFAAIFISLGEALFHAYMQSRVLNEENNNDNIKLHEDLREKQTHNAFHRYQTEFGEEEGPIPFHNGQQDTSQDKED
ncbi:YndM family protein [Litchfieldia alkalitelluris]|uniref:YndM family protein n=1 Tax=Litchfieldia alkalitelluris TaxID=304268 RepID=UPI000998C985|nr:YndM family protein [Litchfieldia alkalitelluris]